MMRVFLLVMIAAAAPAAAESVKFSHKLHLAQGLFCITCHGSAQTSSKASDGNLPSGQICLACHDGAGAPRVELSGLAAIEPASRSFRFNHEFHLGMGNLAPIFAAALDSGKYLGHADGIRRLDVEDACQACHRGLTETDLASKTNLPRMSDCLVCHDRVDNPFSCEKCHLDGVDLLPASHTREFIDLHSTGKLNLDKVSCQPCHGKNFTCMGCH